MGMAGKTGRRGCVHLLSLPITSTLRGSQFQGASEMHLTGIVSLTYVPENKERGRTECDSARPRSRGWRYVSDYSLVTWSKLSSTGVSRSKSETSTMSLPLSGLISLIEPGSPANEPSLIVMVSPISKSTS